VAIFQHSFPFLQSESFQTHGGTNHRRAIGPLAHHNGTLAHTSLTRHLPAPKIECLHRPPYKLTRSSHNFRYVSLPVQSLDSLRIKILKIQDIKQIYTVQSCLLGCTAVEMIVDRRFRGAYCLHHRDE
jgi:hypothetical protein